MLTADLVDARRKDGELLLRTLDAEGREEAIGLASVILETTRSSVGKRREEIEEAWNEATTDVAPKRAKLAAGLKKLAADGCVFEAETLVDPSKLRCILFTVASAARQQGSFDRTRLVEVVANELSIDVDTLERTLFADLRSEHLLRTAPTLNAESLVERWELGQAQAVLLAAVRVVCDVTAASPGLARAFFAKLKFHKLLFSVEKLEVGFRVSIDGPYSMFDSVTKYGLRLAFLLPALRMLEQWALVAQLKWGKTRESLFFKLTSMDTGHGDAQGEGPHIADDVRELIDGINALGDENVKATVATSLLDIPGAGICIPDLELDLGGEERVYVEVLGYWSRDAVWKRVELAERGLGERVVFAISSRLRVSAEVLDETLGAALYVYKGKMSPRAIVLQARKLLKKASATRAR